MKPAPSSRPQGGQIDAKNGLGLSLLDVLDALGTPRGRVTAAIIAALAAGPATLGCGGEDEPEPPAICDTVERQTVTAPEPENVRADAIVDGRMRVRMTIPEFDAECKVPLQIRILATLWGGAEGASFGQPPQDNSDERPLAPFDEEGMEVWGSGDTSVDAEVPAGQRVTSFRVEVTDAQGERFVTAPTIVE